ncbi:MAG: WYL domain-containing protein [Candidatus Omnitrophica bacterium]|nr:WYL domain-containing protein [Candidatus Omnitrophota bacterium]MBU4346790.1 WYL domain-containing protein [Candidatus Omnitrophota bacterium]MBU4472871.1 WYL domain-containing protein [Candidatus Omnitrophota bacterium]MCG2706105.1 WYL domain-containing protein [Candidatus Omnitrophota bacterium]
MHKNIDDVEFSIFDTETTGLEPESGDRIVEIAAIRFKGKQNLATFQSLVNPQRSISEAAFQVNRITPDMLNGAPTIDIVMPKFLDFIQDTCLCSYNAAFDLAFLNNELKRTGRNALGDIIAVDILKMSRRLLPGLGRYALWFVAEKLGIKSQQQHRALSDVELTLKVFHKLKEILKTKSIFDFMNFLSLFGLNSSLLNDINNQKIARIQEAIDLGVRLKIRYLSGASAEVTERQVKPLEIKQDNGKIYLLGHCCLRQAERHFRIDGILHLEII